MSLMCILSLAQADDSVLTSSLLEDVPGGRIDWSGMMLVIEAESVRTMGAWKDRRVQEQA